MLDGNEIPYEKLGFQTLEEMISKIPNVQILNYQGKKVVKLIPTEETAHISKMVARQRPSKKDLRRRNFKPTNYYSPNNYKENRFSWKRPRERRRGTVSIK